MASKAGWPALLLCAALLSGSAAQAPTPEGEGRGPPAAEGVWLGNVQGAPALRLNTPDAYVSVYSDFRGQLVVEYGNYTYFECDEGEFGPGGYKAMTKGSLVPVQGAPDAASSDLLQCEVGKVDLAAGTWTVVSDDMSCLSSLDGATTLTRILHNSAAQHGRRTRPGQCGGS